MNIVAAAIAPGSLCPLGTDDSAAATSLPDGSPIPASKDLKDQTNFLAVLMVMQLGVQVPEATTLPTDEKAGVSSSPATLPSDTATTPPSPDGPLPPITNVVQQKPTSGVVANGAFATTINKLPAPTDSLGSSDGSVLPKGAEEKPEISPTLLDRSTLNAPNSQQAEDSPRPKAVADTRPKANALHQPRETPPPIVPGDAIREIATNMTVAARSEPQIGPSVTWEPKLTENVRNVDESNPSLAIGAPREHADKVAIPAVEEKRPASALTDQIHEHFDSILDRLREHGHAEMQMELHPPELGRMQLRVILDDRQVDVRLIVQNDGAKQALDQQLEPLRVRFAEMGLSLGQFDVRRDGGSPNREPPTEPERSVESLQAGRSVAARHRKIYGAIANPNTLVDVIA